MLFKNLIVSNLKTPIVNKDANAAPIVSDSSASNQVTVIYLKSMVKFLFVLIFSSFFLVSLAIYFTEKFSMLTLKVASETTANWSVEEQAIYLA